MAFGRGGGKSMIGGLVSKFLGAGVSGPTDIIVRATAFAARMNDIADEAYSMALDMAGNDGQLAILDQIGFHGFGTAVLESSQQEGSGAEDVLADMASHPEAIEEILAEVGQFIDESVAEAMDEYGVKVG